jgi:pimeloyl-ACP methyl ester carboxylesterase
MSSARHASTADCILVHGYLDGSAVWQRLVDRLDDAGWGAQALRLKPVADAQRTSGELLEEYARQVRAECARLSPNRPVVLVGHSMGGAIVELAAAQGVPGLVGLVLVTPAPLRGFPLPEEVMQRFVARADLTNRDEIRAGKQALSVALDDAAQDVLATATLETGAAFALEQLKAWTGGHPDGLLASRADVPVQVITTDDKTFTAEFLEQESRRYGDVEICKVSGAGHWPHLERPELLTEAMNRFLVRIAAVRSVG